MQVAGGSERTGSYGGGFEPPVTHQIAFLGLDGDTPRQATAGIAQHQPRALAWDSTRDALYVAGLGNDTRARATDRWPVASTRLWDRVAAISVRRGAGFGPAFGKFRSGLIGCEPWAPSASR